MGFDCSGFVQFLASLAGARLPRDASQQSFVGVLLDDSLSMRIADGDAGARSDYVRTTFGPEGSLRKALEFTGRMVRPASSALRQTVEKSSPLPTGADHFRNCSSGSSAHEAP